MIQQLGVGALLDQSTLVQDQDPLGPAHAGEPVGDDEGGAVPHEDVEGLFDQPLGFGVQGGSGLVQDQQDRVPQDRPGDGQALALAAQVPGGAYFTKWIIAVDDDIDPSNMDEVLWAMGSRCNPADDIDILRDTWSTPLDPSQYPPENRPYGSKALINVCKPHKHLAEFPKRTMLSRDIYDSVAASWKSLGLPGQVPDIHTFERDT